MKPSFKNNKVFVCSYPKAMWNHDFSSERKKKKDGVILPVKLFICFTWWQMWEKARKLNSRPVTWLVTRLGGACLAHKVTSPSPAGWGSREVSSLPCVCVTEGFGCWQLLLLWLLADGLLCWAPLRQQNTRPAVLWILQRIRLMGGSGRRGFPAIET